MVVPQGQDVIPFACLYGCVWFSSFAMIIKDKWGCYNFMVMDGYGAHYGALS